MDLRRAVDIICTVSIPVMVVGIPMGMPVFLPCILLMVIRLLTSDYDTAGFFLVMFGGLLGGLIREMYPSVPVYGLLMIFIGLCLLARRLPQMKKDAFLYFGIFLIFILISFFYGPRSEYSVRKLYLLASNGLFALVAFAAFNRTRRFSPSAIAQLLIMESLAMMSFAIQNGIASPNSMFDYTWLREASERIYYNTGERPIFNYQAVGMNVLYAFTFLLTKRKPRIPMLALYTPICLHMILASGARQAIFGLAIVVAFRVVFFSKMRRRGKILASLATGLLIIGYFALIFNSRVDTAAGMVSSETGQLSTIAARSVNYIAAFDCIGDHPVTGAGLGGYESYIEGMGEQYGKWPHNMILEILCEMGMVGMLAVIVLIWSFFRKTKVRFRHLTGAGLLYFLPMIALLCRFMVSGDLSDSVVVFSAMFAVSRIPAKVRKRKAVQAPDPADDVPVPEVQHKYMYSVVLPYRDKYDLFVKAFDSIPDRPDIQIIIVDNAPENLAPEAVPHKLSAHVDYMTSSPLKGAGHARNVGLGKVEGKWLLFLDADDYFLTDAFDSFDKYMDSPYDIVFFRPSSIRLDNGTLSDRHVYYAGLVQKWGEDGVDKYLRYRWEPPWSKMFRSGFVLDGGYRFEEIKVSNDTWFSAVTGHNAKKVWADLAVVYIVTEGGIGQSLKNTINRETAFIRFECAVRTNLFFKSVGRYSLRHRLLGYLRIALKEFGLREMIRYWKYARKAGLGIF